jgi:hypothetical protein
LISEDVDGVIGTATQDTVITLNGTPLEISNFIFLNASKDGGDVRVSSSGDLEENTAVSPIGGGSNISNALASDIFFDAMNGDFRLLSGSDPIDSGRDLSSTFSDDVGSNTRDANFDRGAFEF